jgi:hypothetical protein
MITLIFVLVLIGVLLWFVETYIPMAPPVRTLLRIVVVIVLVLYVLRVFGIVVP